MTATVFQEEKQTVAEVPDYLVYEEMNGRKFYRRGYKNVLNQTKTIEEIMGCSSLQGIVISVLLSYLYRNVEDEGFTIVTNEIGLHVSLGENLSADIILYDAEDALKYQFDEHYFNVAPKMVIEVDIKADMETTDSVEYLTQKNKTLFAFGVERVVWVFTKDKKVLLAEPNQDWILRDWSRDFELLAGHQINLEKMIAKKGYKI